MKIKKGFIVRKIGGQNVAVAVGEASKEFNGMIKLNETGKFLWDLLEKGALIDELVEKVLEEYEVDESTARADVEKFVENLKELGALEP